MEKLGNKSIKLIAVLLAVLCSLMFMFSNVSADGDKTWPQAPEIDGDAVYLMEANTQAVIYEKNQDEKMYPASTTKILTAILVLENCSLSETVTFTEECCDLEEGATSINAVPGEEMSLKDVMYGLLLPSGNDCAIALAIHVAGSVDAFAEMMNTKAREIGCTDSNFVNPSGLYNANHYTTASDLAKIAWYAFQNSTFVDIISHPTYIIEPTNKTSESRVLNNTHEMITPGSDTYNASVIGGKTGYLYEAGRCLVTYARKDGITLLAVILDGSYYGIFNATQELLDFGWDNFSISNVSENEKRFSYGENDAKVQLDSSSQILTLNGVSFLDLTSKINYAYYLNEDEYKDAKLEAGITEGDNRQLYATIDYSYDGHYLGSCNVFIDPDLTFEDTEWIYVYYINIWLVILSVVVIAIVVLLIIRSVKKRREQELRRNNARSGGRRPVRNYDRSDSINLQDQYIRSSNRNHSSVHSLQEIGIRNVQGQKQQNRRNTSRSGSSPARTGVNERKRHR